MEQIKEKDIITISDNKIVYRISRKQAQYNFYYKILETNGPAKNRYIKIYCDIVEGKDFCTDER